MNLVQWSTCRHCGARFRNPAFDLLIGEQDKAAALGQFGLKLAQHLLEQHRNVEDQNQMMLLQFAGMLRMVQFSHGSEMVNLAIGDLLNNLEAALPDIRAKIEAGPAIPLIEI